MKIIIFSASSDTIEDFKMRDTDNEIILAYDLDTLTKELTNSQEELIVIADYDSVAQDINKLITSNTLPNKTIVLERIPEIASGKMLIKHGVKAYGNSRMLYIHYKQMLDTVEKKKIWTYPELTAALSKTEETINNDAKELIENRLTQKELDVVYGVLEGLTNDAISHKLDITTRTVKAHMSSIFQKLHVNDRVSLVLLLK